ncbi:hypothetical protein [Epibacterium ulvae]|uniref:hypothetical protein n=1 Tax=Epibacterium ulvae TaxID=1156985 RepID=UPI002493B965|nr:hypothetical protein [Epibacterium ulvae]
MKRTPDGRAAFGEIASELEDLAQAVRQCILTPKGSVPLDLETGCDLEQYRDRPQDVRRLFAVAEVRTALERDVPRIEIRALDVDVKFSSLLIKVTWVPREWVLDEFITTEVAL